MFVARTPLSISLAVWKALFLREAITRIWSSRTAWLWLFVEPLFHIAYLMLIFTVVHVRKIGGIETPVWLMVGLLGFFVFKRTAAQSEKAVGANKALFAFRQVKPVDCVIVRSVLELLLMTLIAIILFSAAAFFGFPSIPSDPMALLVAFSGMWMAGFGFGLISSVAIELVPEIGRFLSLATTPLYLLSGVTFPIAAVPPPYRDWILLNPLVHGLEAMRLSVAPYYHAVPGVDLSYLFGCSTVTIFIGLALHHRFSLKLVMK